MCASYMSGAKGISQARAISPLASLARRVKELDPAKEIVAVCRSGNRSISAALILQRAGYTKVSSMAGGMMSWMRHRFPVTR